jgi:hypothetical protein
MRKIAFCISGSAAVDIFPSLYSSNALNLMLNSITSKGISAGCERPRWYTAAK